MLNAFKTLAVFTALTAVAIMAVAVSTWQVAPDLRAEMNTPAMLNYSFEQSAGENPQWTVTRRFSTNPNDPNERGTVGTYPSGYDALIKAHDDYRTALSNRTSAAAGETTNLIAQTDAFRAKQQQDLLAMDNKIAALKSDADTIAKRLLMKSGTLQDLSVKGREIRDETAQRRTDVLRLQHELEEIRTDLYRLTAIRRDLMDRLLRTQIENQELTDRTSQLNP
ncbi:MAG: hypothetical protein RL215_1806 [Planctomycetota bacterium]|jgi:hypothetical protein